MKSKTLFLVASLTALLTGCATLNKDECAYADWQQIGYEDGQQGYSQQRLADHRKACAKHGFTPDQTSYYEGHARGLLQYCTPARGYREGIKGRTYRGVCPAELDQGFILAYQAGKQIYRAKSEIRRAEGQVNESRKKLEELNATLRQQETALIIAESIEQRVVIQGEIRTLQEQVEQHKADLLLAEQKLVEQRMALALLEAKPKPY